MHHIDARKPDEIRSVESHDVLNIACSHHRNEARIVNLHSHDAMIDNELSPEVKRGDGIRKNAKESLKLGGMRYSDLPLRC